MAVIVDYRAFSGEHCETSTTGNLLKHAGLPLSEPMLYGLGEGLAFGVFDFKGMPVPFIGGRPKGEEITRNLARHLGFGVEYRKTRSRKKAWENVAGFIDRGQPVGVKLDMYFLDYVMSGTHFAGHYVAAYGYDEKDVWVVDTAPQGGAGKTRRETFEQGRLWKGPMASNALTWTVTVQETRIDWPAVLRAAIASNARSYLNPPIANFGARGIRKAARAMPGWLDGVENAPATLRQVGTLMERGGTGGGLFRILYRDFLEEANRYLESASVNIARAAFGKAASLWTRVSECLQAGTEQALVEGADILIEIADLEEDGANRLSAP